MPGFGFGFGFGAAGKAGARNPYGPELVSNGTFDTNTTGWTPTNATLSVVAGQLRITNTAASSGRAEQAVATEAGATYRWEATGNGGTFAIGSTTGTAGLVNSAGLNGSSSGTFVAPGTQVFINPRTASVTLGFAKDFDNISLRKVL
jgi:hypothetical protein